MSDPRQHHYLFAHRALPSTAFNHGSRLVALARAGALDAALARHWAGLGGQLDPEQRLPFDGLSASAVDAPEHDLVVVRFPQPRGTTEAYFAAICVRRADEETRYLTLELGTNLVAGEPGADGGTHTVLGEWQTDGTHVNYGEGPPAELPEFTEVVLARL